MDDAKSARDPERTWTHDRLLRRSGVRGRGISEAGTSSTHTAHSPPFATADSPDRPAPRSGAAPRQMAL